MILQNLKIYIQLLLQVIPMKHADWAVSEALMTLGVLVKLQEMTLFTSELLHFKSSRV